MSTARRRRPRLVRIVRARPRLFLSAAVELVVAALLMVSTTWRSARCLLVGWDFAVALYLVLAAHTIARSSVQVIPARRGAG